MGLPPMLRSGMSVLSALVAILLFPVPVAAGGCGLISTAHGGSPVGVETGDVVSIEGFNFAPGDIVLAFSVDGVELRTETVTAADGYGNIGYFIIDVTPQAGEEGLWGVVGTEVEAACSASTGFPVAPAPAPTPTAGPLIPDVASAPPRASPSLAWLLGAALLLLAGLIVLRWQRSYANSQRISSTCNGAASPNAAGVLPRHRGGCGYSSVAYASVRFDPIAGRAIPVRVQLVGQRHSRGPVAPR